MLGKSCISGTAWWIEMKLLGVLWSQVDREVWFGEGVLVKQKKLCIQAIKMAYL